MDHVYEDYLFSRGLLVALPSDYGKDAHPAEALVALAHFAGIRVTSNPGMANLHMLRVAQRNLGCRVPEPFYRGFPKSVRRLSTDQLLLDKLLHYIDSYGPRALMEAGHSVFERYVERLAFTENVKPKPFAIITQDEAERLLASDVEGMLASTRPLNDTSYELVLHYLQDYGWPKVFCASKDTACRLLLDLRDVTLTDLIQLPDVIRLVEWLLEKSYPNMRLNKLNLRNRDRKFICRVLDRLFARGDCNTAACLEKRRAWVGLLHHLHYHPTCPQAQTFCDTLRGHTARSAYAEFEQLVKAKDIRGATDHLLGTKGAAAVARNLAYLISRSSTQQEADHVLEVALAANKVVLAQLIVHFYCHNHPGRRVFHFARMNRLIKHAETPREAGRRKSILDEDFARHVLARLEDALGQACHGKLGKVYADPALHNTALPLQESTSQGGFGTLPRGSRIPLPSHKKLRAFVYWEKVGDIDLSCQGLDEQGNLISEFSWRQIDEEFSNSEAITYSGDETSGWDGGSEYFDIDPVLFRQAYPRIRYAVVCANVYTWGRRFSSCVCRAGYMMRDVLDSGEVFEPSTVESSFTVDCDSSAAFLYALDLQEDVFVWLNVAHESSQRVAGNENLGFLLDYFRYADAISLYDFARMLATEVVDTPQEADVIFSDEELALRDDQRQIRSRDTAAVLGLLNS